MHTLTTHIEVTQSQMFPRRRSFLDKDAPPGYIPGIGRGAAGFTTRSDVGTARLPPRSNLVLDSDDERFGDVDADGHFQSVEDKDDEEADEIYKAVENRLKMRSRKRVRLDEVTETTNMERISGQFVDLKKDLGSVSETQWALLPEVGDLTKRNKRLRQEANKNRVEYAAPDSLLTGLDRGGTDTSVDISALTAQREKLLESKIDANFDIDEEEKLDHDGYLKEISALNNSNEEEIKRMTAILTSYTKADPKKPEGWIARARLEETRNNFENARKLIQQGCNNCPKDEEIWLENVRLNQHDIKYSKIIIAEAVKFNNKSLRLWLKAAELEQEPFNKKRIIRKALESLPTSETLWIELLTLEEDAEDRRRIAQKSLEFIPLSVDIWLKLIDMQSYDDAKSTLNRARKALGGDNVQIWLAACRLEFVNNPESDKVGKLVKKAMKECVGITRDEWFAHAVRFEEDGLTYLATVFVGELMSSEDADYDKWLEDSKKFEDHVYVLKTVLNQVVIHFPKKIAVWRRLIQLYKRHFETEELFKIFENIVEILPKNAIFWLMYSKEVWKTVGDLEKAKMILQRALDGPLPKNTDVWCALIKLETVSRNTQTVERLFEQAKATLKDERIWYKLVTFQRQQSDFDGALKTIEAGLGEFVECWKLYLQKAQILLEKDDLQAARNALAVGTRQVPTSSDLWIALSHVDEQLGNLARARSDLDLGLLKIKDSGDRMWCEKLELERRSGNESQCRVLLTKALQEFPKSSLLWSFKLKYTLDKKQKKTAFKDALQATENDSRVLVLIGMKFWREGKPSKSQLWFERALLYNEDFGDAWAWNYLYMIKQKGLAEVDEELQMYLKKFAQVEPRHGDAWPVVAKKIENLDKEPIDILKLVAEEVYASLPSLNV